MSVVSVVDEGRVGFKLIGFFIFVSFSRLGSLSTSLRSFSLKLDDPPNAGDLFVIYTSFTV